jgi:hypothetical protein
VGQLEDRELAGIAEVDVKAILREQKSLDPLQEIVDVAEAARLRAVSALARVAGGPG